MIIAGVLVPTNRQNINSDHTDYSMIMVSLESYQNQAGRQSVSFFIIV